MSKIGDYCIQSFHNNGIGTVIKHIPGHGRAKVDSHYFTPIIGKNHKISKFHIFLTNLCLIFTFDNSKLMDGSIGHRI